MKMSHTGGLRPEYVEFFAARTANPLPEVWEAPVQVLRKNVATSPAIRGTAPEGVSIDHRFFAGPTSDLPLRIYRPHNKKLMPAVVFYHGGGWVLNNLGTYDVALSTIAKEGEFTVVAVNYQKAPEHKFPIPFDDCFATLEWVYANAAELNIPQNSRGEYIIGVMGVSAGANLASACALKAKEIGKYPLKFQALFYPCNDNLLNFESAYENSEGFGLSTRAMQWFWNQYLSSGHDASNHYAVPARANNLTGVAPAIDFTAEFDPLLDDGYNYAQLLKSHGVHTSYREFDGVPHGFFNSNGVTPVAREAQKEIVREINALIERDWNQG